MTPIKATSKMCPTIHNFSSNLLPQPPKFQPYALSSNLFLKHSSAQPRTLKISCSKDKESLADETLAVELGLEIKKLNSQVVQREEALKKSRELLFAEMCNFEGLKSEDLRKKWRKMDEEERRGLAKGFVAEWSARFHPLSARSVKEMVEEYMDHSNEFSDSVSRNLFPGLGKILGFSQDTEE